MFSDSQLAKIAARLDPEEEIIVAVPAESGLSLLFVFVSSLLRFFTRQWIVVRTNRRFVVLKRRGGTPRSFVREYPLDAPADFVRNGLWLRLTLGGDRFRVSGVFRDDLDVLVGRREPDRPVPMNLECPACGYMNRQDAVTCSKCRELLH